MGNAEHSKADLHPISLTMAFNISIFLKVSLLVINSACAHISFRSPNSAPPKEEQARYTKRATFSFGENGFTAVHAGLLTRVGANFFEFYDALLKLFLAPGLLRKFHSSARYSLCYGSSM